MKFVPIMAQSSRVLSWNDRNPAFMPAPYVQHTPEPAPRTAPDRDADTRRLTVERPEHKLPVLEEIEPGPVQVWHAVENQRCHVRRVRDRITLALEQRHKLVPQLIVRKHRPSQTNAFGLP